jgi:hypothetical protein
MPEKLKRKLRAAGRKKGYRGARLDAYVYGAMRKKGWKPSGEKK